jgi:mono/diheme cytochrome c family protein
MWASVGTNLSARHTDKWGTGAGLVEPVIDPDLPGHVIAPNITPAPDTGIGKWSETDIVVALRDGKRPDGSIIGPPMPIPMYRQLSDKDAEAIAAYLHSLSPVRDSLQKSQYKIQLTEYGAPATHVDAPSPEDKVAYGGYLMTIGHCVLCHTPPGDGQPVDMKLAFAGGREFGSIGQIGPEHQSHYHFRSRPGRREVERQRYQASDQLGHSTGRHETGGTDAVRLVC